MLLISAKEHLPAPGRSVLELLGVGLEVGLLLRDPLQDVAQNKGSGGEAVEEVASEVGGLGNHRYDSTRAPGRPFPEGSPLAHISSSSIAEHFNVVRRFARSTARPGRDTFTRIINGYLILVLY